MLIVTPYDPAKPGSHRQRQQIMRELIPAQYAYKRISKQIEALQGHEDDESLMQLELQRIEMLNVMDNFVRAYTRSDAGKSLDEEFDLLSENDFMQLVDAVMGILPKQKRDEGEEGVQVAPEGNNVTSFRGKETPVVSEGQDPSEPAAGTA